MSESQYLYDEIRKQRERINTLEGNCDRLQATATRRLELLRRLEWHVSDHPANAYCLICGRYKREGHASYCDLAKELQEVTA